MLTEMFGAMVSTNPAKSESEQPSRRSILRFVGAAFATAGVAGCITGTSGEHPDCPDGSASLSTAFAVDYDAAAGQVVARHEGGSTVDASRVYVHGDGLSSSGSWDSLSDAEFSSEGRIRTGDTATVDADASHHAIVEWGQMLGCEDYVLAEHDSDES